MKRRKRIMQQVSKDRCKGETSFFETIATNSVVKKNLSTIFRKHLNFYNFPKITSLVTWCKNIFEWNEFWTVKVEDLWFKIKPCGFLNNCIFVLFFNQNFNSLKYRQFFIVTHLFHYWPQLTAYASNWQCKRFGIRNYNAIKIYIKKMRS